MAAALIGGSFLGAFLQVLFDRMATPEFLNLFHGRKGDAQLLKKLERKLIAVQAVLDDAENRETANPRVKQWLEDLHHTIGEAEDLLDKINTEALRVKVETGGYPSPGNNPVGSSSARFSSSSSSQKFLDGMMPQIKKVVDSLEEFIQYIVPLGLQVGEPKRPSFPRHPSTCLVDDVTFGRDGDKQKIVEMLLSDDDDVFNGDCITVVSIVGLVGLGKTTLAQLVYQDDRVKQHFPDTKAWICVSEEYDATRITKDLLRELHVSVTDPDESFNSLQEKLQNALNQKKFLLVLDDVWNSHYNDWDVLRKPFKGGLRGSKIIVTTRDQEVARMMGKEESIHLLDVMSEENSWSLFKKHAFETTGGRDQNPKLVEIGKKIVNKCRGLPLAVKTVAGFLRTKTIPDEWEDVLKSEVWSRIDNQYSILPALRLSYMHLPPYLKRCFAYCAVFPKDYNFKKEKVIQFWLAHDLVVHPGDNRPPENTGEECFRELVSRSFFQRKDDKSFFMHDLVNDLARSVSGKYCLRLEDYNLQTHSTIARLNHFSYILKGYGTYDQFKLLEEATDLRTFLPLGMFKYQHSLSDKFLQDLLPKFKSLRALSLCHYDIFRLPDSLSALKQLRSLDLSNTSIQKLPKWICTLYNLQTLLLSSCENLEELPVDLEKLINLSYLDISKIWLKRMPTNIGRSLRNIRLTILKVGKDSGAMIEALGKFDEIGDKLRLSGLENVACGESASMANIKSKKQLENLTLEWGGVTKDSQIARDVLQGLEPPSTIKYLKINGYDGTRFPDWVGSPSFCHVKSLILDSCLNCFEVPALGRLQSLESLEIFRMSNIFTLSGEMYRDISETKPFPSLKKFIIKEMLELERWDIPAECEAFYSLKELYIIDCPKLVVVGQLPLQLEILEVSRCHKLVLPNGRLGVFDGDDSRLSSLRILKMSDLKNLKELWLNFLPSHLEILKIEIMEVLERWNIPAKCEAFCNLKELRIIGCPKLVVVGQLPLKQLEILEVSGCDKLVLPDGRLGVFDGDDPQLPSLRKLKMSTLKNLKELWLNSLPSHRLAIERMEELERCDMPAGCEVFCNLKVLRLIGCPKLVFGHLPLKQLGSLKTFEISECDKLVLPDGRLSVFDHRDIQQLSSLRELKISALKNMKELWLGPDILPSGLESLEIRDCESLLTFLVDGSNLERLILQKCKCLKVVQLGSFPMLKQVQIIKCKSIEMLLCSIPSRGIQSGGSSSSSNLASLTYLEILDCKGLMYFPEGGLHAPNLTQFYIRGCKKLKSLPEQMKSLLPSLIILSISDCPEIECFPEGGLPCSTLQSLKIYGCEKLMREWDLPRLPSLTKLTIDGFGESFPNEDWLLPCTLQALHLRRGDKVKMLNYSGLGHLTSLKTLKVESCPLLHSLPDEGLPASLARLEIRKCPLLTPRIEWGKGQDLPKVARIPCVELDGKIIS